MNGRTVNTDRLKRSCESGLPIVICVPPAGFGSAFYRGWGPAWTGRIEVVPITLPGRESRYQERAYEDIQLLADELAVEVATICLESVRLYGHSMGGIVAFETARRLNSIGRHVERLVVGACIAPQRWPLYQVRMSQLRDSEVAQLVEAMTLATNPDVPTSLVRGMAPAIQADLVACERYDFTDNTQIRCPIVAITGDRDSIVTESEVASWRELSLAAGYEHVVVAGDHLSCSSPRERLLAAIAPDRVAPIEPLYSDGCGG